ncbi:hypothetical protein PIB30_055609 [Stylosanthes scabra]|uniref:Uncharacterized protein n=1 Tax=Stylosanthes scabra TaxID=79078 RepID=A0ABU6XHQ4_9FABA|nr:hypothetical protein [Stylosanthes scabra]
MGAKVTGKFTKENFATPSSLAPISNPNTQKPISHFSHLCWQRNHRRHSITSEGTGAAVAFDAPTTHISPSALRRSCKARPAVAANLPSPVLCRYWSDPAKVSTASSHLLSLKW